MHQGVAESLQFQLHGVLHFPHRGQIRRHRLAHLARRFKTRDRRENNSTHNQVSLKTKIDVRHSVEVEGTSCTQTPPHQHMHTRRFTLKCNKRYNRK